MEHGVSNKVWNRFAVWLDTLCVAIEIGLPSEEPCTCDDQDSSQPAITAIEELQRLGRNTSFVPRFPLEFVTIEHPGRITANGLGTLEVGHSDDRFPELPGVSGTATAP